MIENLVLEEPIEEKKDEKKKKYGVWDKSFNKKKLAKNQKVAVLYLTTNGQALPMELEPKNGFFSIRSKTYHEREDCTWVFGKQRIPLAIIRENSIIPDGKESWLEKTISEKFLILQTHAMNGIRHAELVRLAGDQNKPINVKAAVLIVIAIIIGIAVWQGGLI